MTHTVTSESLCQPAFRNDHKKWAILVITSRRLCDEGPCDFGVVAQKKGRGWSEGVTSLQKKSPLSYLCRRAGCIKFVKFRHFFANRRPSRGRSVLESMHSPMPTTSEPQTVTRRNAQPRCGMMPTTSPWIAEVGNMGSSLLLASPRVVTML